MNTNAFKKEVKKIYSKSLYNHSIGGKELIFNRHLSDDEFGLIREWYTPSKNHKYGYSQRVSHKPNISKWQMYNDLSDMQNQDIIDRFIDKEKLVKYSVILVGEPKNKNCIKSYLIKHKSIISILTGAGALIIPIVIAIIKK